MKEKWESKEYKKNPLANYSDALNKTYTGDLGSLSKGGCLTSIILVLVCICILYFNSK